MSSGFIKIKDALNEIADPSIKSKGTHHEFQDFAYRLAAELNDLDRLGVYMRLVKNNPRSLLQEAYQFVIDSKIDNKGKLFMWKFKKLKLEFENKKNEENFDYKYVSKNISELRKLFSKKIIQNDVDNLKYEKIISKFLDNNITSILVLNYENYKLLPKEYQIKNLDISILENCTPIYDLISKNFIKKKVFKSDFFNKKFKRKYDVIIIGNFWNYFPHGLNNDFLQKLSLISKIEAKYIFKVKVADISTQKWIFTENLNFPIFSKKTNLDKLYELFKLVGLEILNELKFSETENLIFCKKFS